MFIISEREKQRSAQPEAASPETGVTVELANQDERKTGPRYDDIIQAAINVFARTNYDKATTAMIAREAGVAEGTPFRYFKSKKGIFLACYRHIERLMVERYTQVYRETKDRPIEYLRGVAKTYVEFLLENPNMRKFLAFILCNSFDEDFFSELKDFMERNVQATEIMFRKAIENGELRESVDPKAAAWLFAGGYFTFILMTELGVEEIKDPDYVNRMIDLVIQ